MQLWGNISNLQNVQTVGLSSGQVLTAASWGAYDSQCVSARRMTVPSALCSFRWARRKTGIHPIRTFAFRSCKVRPWSVVDADLIPLYLLSRSGDQEPTGAYGPFRHRVSLFSPADRSNDEMESKCHLACRVQRQASLSLRFLCAKWLRNSSTKTRAFSE